jgi:hypothetical protein
MYKLSCLKTTTVIGSVIKRTRNLDVLIRGPDRTASRREHPLRTLEQKNEEKKTQDENESERVTISSNKNRAEPNY